MKKSTYIISILWIVVVVLVVAISNNTTRVDKYEVLKLSDFRIHVTVSDGSIHDYLNDNPQYVITSVSKEYWGGNQRWNTDYILEVK